METEWPTHNFQSFRNCIKRLLLRSRTTASAMDEFESSSKLKDAFTFDGIGSDVGLTSSQAMEYCVGDWTLSEESSSRSFSLAITFAIRVDDMDSLQLGDALWNGGSN